ASRLNSAVYRLLVLLFLLTICDCFLRDHPSQYQAVQLTGGTSDFTMRRNFLRRYRSRREQRRPRFLPLIAAGTMTLSALTTLSIVQPAVADTGNATPVPAPTAPAPPRPATLGTFRSPDDSGLTSTQQSALSAAKKQAADSGDTIAVDALTTETSTTQVGPSGRMTYTSSLLPVRVRKNSSWVPVDATLQKNKNGTFSPKAAAEPLTFSGGGHTPLVTMTSGKASLAMSWPAPLPTPHVSGDQITYPDVLPAVDLQLTVKFPL
ncbi:hypothetical protein JFN87_33245, partial [Streptomyces bomunensis]|nr:hypothetical protein [Streptomyces montanisoli]